jgi:topoisomerase-4 subunit A
LAQGQAQVACLAQDGRLLIFALDELKLQPNGGRGLTLMDVDDKAPLIAVACFGDTLRVVGSGRGGKPKEELLKPAGWQPHVGKRARKGRKVAALVKVSSLA